MKLKNVRTVTALNFVAAAFLVVPVGTKAAVVAVPAKPEPSAPVVVDRGSSHRLWMRTTPQVLPSGKIQSRNTFTCELATGIHFKQPTQDGGWEWAESKELIEPAPNGAVARYGQIRAAFAAKINTPGAIQVLTEGGEMFTINPTGLAYTDVRTGHNVLIAAVQDSVGEILPPNRIIYRNFLDSVLADLVITYTRFGVESDIHLLESLPPPEQFGPEFDSRTARLEVYTEFANPPAPSRSAQVLDSAIVLDPLQPAAFPRLIDETLAFSNVRLGPGRSFDLNGGGADAPVAKSWVTIPDENTQMLRTFLIEAVELPAIENALAALPRREARNNAKPRLPDKSGVPKTTPERRLQSAGFAKAGLPAPLPNKPGVPAIHRSFPPAPKPATPTSLHPMHQAAQSAKANTRGKGLVIDYVFTLTTGLTNYNFISPWTFFVAGPVSLYGTSTLSGGIVVKMAPDSANSYLEFNGAIVCDTTPWLPAVFTASTDSSMGDVVTAGPISGYYGVAALRSSTNVTGTLHDLRIKYAATAIKWTGSTERFSNIQLIACSNGIQRISAAGAPVHNVLASNVRTLFLGSNSSIDAEQVTASSVGALFNLTGSPSTLALTNAILANVTNYGAGILAPDYIGTYNSFTVTGLVHGVAATAPVFASSVGGNFYLPASCSLRWAGTPAIAAEMLAELPRNSTYAPIYLTNTLESTMVLGPVCARENPSQPSLGYGYPNLDWIVSSFTLSTNALLIITNGSCVGVDYGVTNGSSAWGFIFDTAKLISQGSVERPNRITRAHCVQENSSGNPGTRAWFYDSADALYGNFSEARFRFTEFTGMAFDGYTLYVGGNWADFEISHCFSRALSFSITCDGGAGVYGLTNNVFETTDMFFTPGEFSTSVIHLRNNLYRNDALHFAGCDANSTIRECLFDNMDLDEAGSALANSNNAYWQTSHQFLGGVTNITLTNLSYAIGPFSRYYQPTNASQLWNSGSRAASLAGLYHFCSTVDNVKETNSIVDCGPHWPAAANGSPIDTDGDDVPDYRENVSGSVASGESNWQIANDWGLRVFLTRPKSGSIIP